MPATGLKIVGTGACLPWCLNSLKTSGHQGYEFLEFWCWNLISFLPDIGFQLLKSSWSSLTYFSFNDVPNVPYKWKMRGIIYKMACRNHPKFDLTIISRICVRLIHRTTYEQKMHVHVMCFRCEIYESQMILNLHAIEWFQLSACKRLLINVINIKYHQSS